MAKTKKTEAKQRVKGRVKTRDGLVVSNKMNKTIVVAVIRQVKHGEYGKYMRRTSKFFAHDEKNDCQIGDLVRIEETRPMSKNKRWKLTEVLRRAV